MQVAHITPLNFLPNPLIQIDKDIPIDHCCFNHSISSIKVVSFASLNNVTFVTRIIN